MKDHDALSPPPSLHFLKKSKTPKFRGIRKKKKVPFHQLPPVKKKKSHIAYSI
jgi:hypothetical protein